MSALNHLEELAKAATAGPWCEHPNGTSIWSGSDYDTSGVLPQKHLLSATSMSAQAVADVEFVAAANPEVLLKIVAALRAAQAVRDELAGSCHMTLDSVTRFDAALADVEDLFKGAAG